MQSQSDGLLAICAAAAAMGDAERRGYAELLEAQVRERTRALSETNNRLQAEIAEREKTDAALCQAQKLQAMGQMAGGIAHDFNNLLATILGCLELMERRLEQGRGADDTRVHSLIERATDAVQRGAQLTSRLLSFSRLQRLDVRVTDLNRLVSDLVTLASSTLGRRVRVCTDLAAELWPAIADPSQVEAALLNLCLNARDAMPEGGVLTIATANETIVGHKAPDEPEPGAYVRISVTDTGVGMSRDVLSRVFEPFFTTKGPGGSGLGLSQVYGLARQSGGTVWIRSEPGQGTEVSLLLPRASEAEMAATPPRPMAAAVRSSKADLVLLVDDDPAVRQVTADMLRDLGWRVLEAAGGDEALALLAGHAASGLAAPDVLMLDHAMPGMNGLELARALRARGNMAPILLATGYPELPDPPGIGTDLLAGVLRKPFSLRDLRAALQGLRPRQAEQAALANVVPLRGAART
jgi:signal transduction histidine kinase/ActR/RegA family two-component response regulator